MYGKCIFCLLVTLGGNSKLHHVLLSLYGTFLTLEEEFGSPTWNLSLSCMEHGPPVSFLLYLFLFHHILFFLGIYLGAAVSDRTFFNHVSVQKCSVTYRCTQVQSSA